MCDFPETPVKIALIQPSRAEKGTRNVRKSSSPWGVKVGMRANELHIALGVFYDRVFLREQACSEIANFCEEALT